MNCAKCGRKIPSGEKYISDVRSVECVERKFFRTAITVKDTEDVVTYHMACAPVGLLT